MAFSFTISKALSHTSIDDVIENVQELDLGPFSVDEKMYERDGEDFKKFWIHCDAWPTHATARDLRVRLEQNAEKQRQGGQVAPADIPRIVYGVNRRTGKDMYWQIFICPTKDERQATYDNKTVKPKAKIVM
jgi:hypothetical protein